MLHIERLSISINKMGKYFSDLSTTRSSDLTTATSWLNESVKPELVERLQSQKAREERWDGALPCTNDPLHARISEQGSTSMNEIIIGADGSQIYPDRHAAVQYFLIQCGALIYRYDGGIPETKNTERLYFEDSDLYDTRGYLVSVDMINLRRSVQEMQFIAEVCDTERQQHPDASIYAVLDGPLLWPYPEQEHQISPEFETYMAALDKIQRSNVIPVGYIDRPAGKRFLNTLWINHLSNQEFNTITDSYPLHTLHDQDLMGNFLAPGERITWYKRQNSAQSIHSHNGQEIWFCYINLGTQDKSSIARVEIPARYASIEKSVSVLQNLLIHQSQALNGYPYVLARAHELALVTTRDKVALDSLLERVLLEQGTIPRMSDKARQKSYLGHR
jgi:hypothetical protein